MGTVKAPTVLISSKPINNCCPSLFELLAACFSRCQSDELRYPDATSNNDTESVPISSHMVERASPPPRSDTMFHIRIAVGLIVTGIASAQCNTAFCVISNGWLQFGNGGQTSINSYGLLQQPFYKSPVDNKMYKLTYSKWVLLSAFHWWVSI